MVTSPVPVLGAASKHGLGRWPIVAGLLGSALFVPPAAAGAAEKTGVIPAGVVVRYVETFNRHDTELYPQAIANAHAADFLVKHIPRFECPDPDVERTYYFRWWTFRKHLRKTAGHGYVPWYFDNTMPAPERDIAWRQLADPEGFWAPFGPTTCEQRGKGFLLTYTGRFCHRNGPAWPFATAQTLTGLANVINLRGPSAGIRQLREDWLTTFHCYVRSHRLRLDDGTLVPWIDENVNPVNGDWLSRSRFKVHNKGKWREPAQHSKDYNHSTFCDLVITGVAGLRPAEGKTFTVNPIIPASWDYFCLDNVKYHGRDLTLVYDKTGRKYNQGAGLRVLLDGRQVAAAAEIGQPLKCEL